MTRPVCAHCGKPYGRRDTHQVTLRWEEGEPEPPYEGCLQVVRRGRLRPGQRAFTFIKQEFAAEPNRRDIEVWNGRDWFGGYNPFCTLRCALDYARKAYRASIR